MKRFSPWNPTCSGEAGDAVGQTRGEDAHPPDGEALLADLEVGAVDNVLDFGKHRR